MEIAEPANKSKSKRKATRDEKSKEVSSKKRKEEKEAQKQLYNVLDDQIRKNLVVPLNLGGGIVHHLASWTLAFDKQIEEALLISLDLAACCSKKNISR